MRAIALHRLFLMKRRIVLPRALTVRMGFIEDCGISGIFYALPLIATRLGNKRSMYLRMGANLWIAAAKIVALRLLGFAVRGRRGS